MSLVSVIVATFNRCDLLPAAIESATRAGSDSEIIVVDDGSTDQTDAVCRSIAGVRYIRLPSNQGLAAARNAGIRASSAEFVAFLDDDDLRLSGSIDLQIRALRERPDAALCYGPTLLADARRRLPTGEIFPLNPISGNIFWHLLEGLFLCPGTIVARRQALIECELFDEKLRTVEDWDLWLRVAAKWPVIAVPEPVAIYRQASANSEQLCSDTISLLRQTLIVQDTHLKRPPAAAAPFWRRQRARLRLLAYVYNALVSKAAAAIDNGDSQTARETLREAMRLRPLRARMDRNLLRLLRTV